MKDEIKNGEFWEKYLDITDGDLRNTPKDFALSRKNDIKNIGFDFRNNVISKTISPIITNEVKRFQLLAVIEVLINYIIDSVKNIKKHNNFAIPKKWRDFN